MRTAAAVLLSLLLAIPVLGAVRDEPQPAPLSFTEVVRPTPATMADVRGLRPDDTRRVRGVPPEDWFRSADRGGDEGARPNPPVPSPHLIVVPRAPQPTSHRASGVASFYCSAEYHSRCTAGYSGGLYAAAGPQLRVGDWRNRLVRVVASNGRAVVVQLIDCNCGPNANLVDLYSDAFERLAPLSQGVVKVEVSWQ